MDSRRFERERMVKTQLQDRGIVDEKVLKAMLSIERHRFVPSQFQNFAYTDRPLPLEANQTISQPYIVAFMCQALNLSGDEKVLEIGTGSGYETAILTFLAREVYTIEIREELALEARKNLALFESKHLHFKIGDGLLGWPEEALFDAIILSAASPEIPKILLTQLASNGRLIAPIGGEGEQMLTLFQATPHGVETTPLMSVMFVPMKRGVPGYTEAEKPEDD